MRNSNFISTLDGVFGLSLMIRRLIQFFVQVRQNPLSERICITYYNYTERFSFRHGLDCKAIILFFVQNYDSEFYFQISL